MDSSAPAAAEAHVAEAQAPAPSVETQPDVKPIDTPVAPSTPPSSNKTNPSAAVSLGALLKATPSSIDAFLSHLSRCIQTRGGADVVLFFLCYATRLSGAILDDLSRWVLRQSAQQLLTLATKLPPSTTVTFSGPLVPSPSAALAAGALQLATKLKAFSGMVTEIRTFGRLWGLLGLYLSAKRLYLSRIAISSDEKKKQGSGWATAYSALQIAFLISFQASENTAFLASKKVISLPPATTAKIARWGVRSWMLYVFSEAGRHLVERSLRVSAARKKGTTVKAEDAEWDANWKRDFFRNLAWAPLTVHWSVDNGPLNELAISLFALWPASGAMRDLWRANA